jgi:plastocyanin
VTLGCAITLTATACSSLPKGQLKEPKGREFVPMVADSIDDVGLGDSIAVDAEGLPYLSYFGFAAELEPGEIPVARPVGSPFLKTEDNKNAGAVLLAHLTSEQIWTRGAVAQPRETPSGVTVPFGPAALPSLASLTPHNAKGTDLAVDGSDLHVVWTANTGVWYGTGPDPFEIDTVQGTPEAGAPSIALDDSGTPLVAYTVAGAKPEVRVAERTGERWVITPVTTLSACGEGCPPATQIGMDAGQPLVVVADPHAGELIAARRQGGTWDTEVVARDVTGGASLAAAGGTATIAYYTATGVSVATGRFGSWSIEEIAPVTPAPSGGGTDKTATREPSTGIAVDGEGTIWVAWEDREGIHLASSEGGKAFEEVELPQTTGGGVSPSVAVTEDGSSVYLAWYDPVNADLRVGVYAEIADLKIAMPSPTPAPSPVGPPAGCGDDKKVVLDIIAKGTAFDPTCLVAPAGDPFTIHFDNQDPVASTGPHNIVIAVDEAATASDPIFRGDLVSGPAEVDYPVPAIPEAGDYFFHCEVHPTQMTGTLVVVKGAK